MQPFFLGFCMPEEGYDCLGLIGIILGEVADEDIRIQPPHALPFPILSSSSAR